MYEEGQPQYFTSNPLFIFCAFGSRISRCSLIECHYLTRASHVSTALPSSRSWMYGEARAARHVKKRKTVTEKYKPKPF